MKKTGLFLVFIILIASCNKNNVAMKESNYSDLNTISAKYLSKIHNNGVKPMIFGIHIRISKKALRIIGQDLQGLWKGATSGAAAGALISGVGAGPGAVVGAAGASLSEAGKEVKKPKKQDSYNPISNSDNPYDQIGSEHYHVINEALSSSTNYLSNGQYNNTLFYSFSSAQAIEDGVFDSLSLNAFPLDSSNVVLNSVSHSTDTSLVVYLSNITPAFDSVVTNCLTPYLQCFDASEGAKVSDFVSYSIQMEDAVLDLNISDFDKEIILATMATARYGTQYWSLQY